MKKRNIAIISSACISLIMLGELYFQGKERFHLNRIPDSKAALNGPKLNTNNNAKLVERSKKISSLLKTKNFKQLEKYAHPILGINFYPYPNFDLVNPPVNFSKKDLQNIDSGKKYFWGKFDGTGENIEMNFQDYYERFLYDKDFENANEINLNKDIKRGNLINTLRHKYQEEDIVEIYLPGSEEYSWMDWKSLYFVYERFGNLYFLVAIAHNEWTT